jgi:uncharacterized protein YyaL (SSP411 family)
MSNHLIGENSPYLLQHADNPVDWYPWDELALERARQEDKPIFLSIGYAACHWCHVMAHESFEDQAIAAIMNENFINIKVDREERPDLDDIYMQAVVAMTGQGGWPMSLFLTPDGKPFYGGTYFPPTQRYNLPSFREVLLSIARLWREDRSRLTQSGDQISQHLQQNRIIKHKKTLLSKERLDHAAMYLAQSYDWKHGGWGKAPKFPQPMTIEYLLRRSTRGDRLATQIAVHVLHAMTSGGMYDVVGGGFARYSTDDLWCTPHFEKMLYDNAQLGRVYLHAWSITHEANFRKVCEETLDFITREMTDPLGGFYSSLDADSEGEEGKYYLWMPEEIEAALQDQQDVTFFKAAYEVTPTGNFGGKNVLHRSLNDEQLAEMFGLPADEVLSRLDALHACLLEARSTRPRPSTDDKILVAWNGLALAAFAEAARYLNRSDYLLTAQHNARFLLDHAYQAGRLHRSWRAGHTRHNAYLEDYASLILGLLALYQSDARTEWYTTAIQLADEMVTHFVDPYGGFYDTRDDHESLLLRPKDLQDNATPSGNALAISALLQLAAYEDRGDWRDMAEAMLSDMQETMVGYPSAFACWLQAADFALGPVHEIAILGDMDESTTQAMLKVLWGNYRPRQVAAISSFPPESGSPALLADRPLQNQLPTAYVCHDFSCQDPTNSPKDFTAQLAEENTTT